MALGHAMAHDNHVSPMAEAPLKMTQHVEIDAIDATFDRMTAEWPRGKVLNLTVSWAKLQRRIDWNFHHRSRVDLGQEPTSS